jgi:transposase-like protein
VDQLGGRFDDAANMLADAAEDLLAFSTFPAEHWSAVRSNNPEGCNLSIRQVGQG